jgi:hypothetical protein
LALGGVEPAADEADLEHHVGVHLARAGHEGMHQPVHLGDRKAADHADIARRAHRAGDDAGQIGGILDVVVENREIGIGRIGLEARAKQEGDIGIVAGDLARLGLHGKGLADHQIGAAFGIFAHHPCIVGVRDVFGERVVDLPLGNGRLGRDMDTADPLLFDGDRIDAGDLQRGLRAQGRGAKQQAGAGCRDGGAQQAAAGDGGPDQRARWGSGTLAVLSSAA